MNDPTSLSLTQTIDGLAKKSFSESDLNKAYGDRIKKLNPGLNAFLEVKENSKGIPAGIKDLIAVKDMQMTCGSKILEGYTAPYNATVINKLIDNNVSFIGKTNLDEFAMGSSGENSAYGSAKNPWDKNKVPGGSSSGSAAAVAADLCTFALGTDTGGSIRQPASLCGVVGLKPSYGRVSRYGAQAMASSLDQIGPLTKTVADARKVLEWISGPDAYDSNCVKSYFKSTKRLKDLKGITIGIPKLKNQKGSDAGLDIGVLGVMEKAYQKLKELGAEIREIDLPHTEYALAVYYIVMSSEVSSNLARYDGIRFGSTREKFGDEPKRRIMLGTFALSTGYFDDYFIKAAKVRTLVKQDFEKAFEKCDVIVGPVSPTVAWNLGEKISDPLTMYLSDVYTIPASLAGIPGLSVPCGFANDLPVGLQILGKYLDEDTILSVGELYENATDWHKQKPRLQAPERSNGGQAKL